MKSNVLWAAAAVLSVVFPQQANASDFCETLKVAVKQASQDFNGLKGDPITNEEDQRPKWHAPTMLNFNQCRVVERADDSIVRLVCSREFFDNPAQVAPAINSLKSQIEQCFPAASYTQKADADTGFVYHDYKIDDLTRVELIQMLSLAALAVDRTK